MLFVANTFDPFSEESLPCYLYQFCISIVCFWYKILLQEHILVVFSEFRLLGLEHCGTLWVVSFQWGRILVYTRNYMQFQLNLWYLPLQNCIVEQIKGVPYRQRHYFATEKSVGRFFLKVKTMTLKYFAGFSAGNRRNRNWWLWTFIQKWKTPSETAFGLSIQKLLVSTIFFWES